MIEERKTRKKKTPSGSMDLAVVRDALEPQRVNLEQGLRFVASVAYEQQLPGFLGRPECTGLEALSAMHDAAHQAKAQVEAQRTERTKPLLAEKRAVDEVYKPLVELCDAIKGTCNKRLQEYERARKAAQREAAEHVQLDITDPTVLAVAHGGAPELPAEVQSRTCWTYKVLDFHAIPDAYKTLNESALRAVITATRGQCQIPGVLVVEDVRIVATGRVQT
jgi:hypothetical protein